MISRTTRRFRDALRDLPQPVQAQATAAYARFRNNPNHPNLRFKKIHPTEPIYAVRITRYYRAVGVRAEGLIVWFWIGSHAGYEQLISRL